MCNLSPETEARAQASKQKLQAKFFNLESIKFGQKNGIFERSENEEKGNKL